MNVTCNIDPVYEFEYELSCIENDLYYEIAVRAILQAPDYFWIVPASSSGKYHPVTSLGTGGLVRHVKSVYQVSEELLTHPLYAPFDSIGKDKIRVAILLHDICKQGLGSTNEHTVPEHPLLVREGVRPWKDDESISKEMSEGWSAICDLIEPHMGVWNKNRSGKEILPVPSGDMQLFVHLCDYIASRKSITVDIYSRKSQESKVPIKEDWKLTPATLNIEGGVETGQIPYIKKLQARCLQKGLNVELQALTDEKGKVLITKGEASNMIQQLKQLIGVE